MDLIALLVSHGGLSASALSSITFGYLVYIRKDISKNGANISNINSKLEMHISHQKETAKDTEFIKSSTGKIESMVNILSITRGRDLK